VTGTRLSSHEPSTPSHDNAKQGAKEEADHRRHPDQDGCPGQTLTASPRRPAVWEVGKLHRAYKFACKKVTGIRQVLRPERVVTQPEHCDQCLLGAGA